MQRIITAAAILLIIQLGLAVVLNMTDHSFDAFVPSDVLLQFDDQSVDSVTITGGAGEQLMLKKEQGNWIIPDLYGAAADKQQVEDFLEKLKELKHGLAVATSADATQRFKVAQDGFERRIVLRQGDKVVSDLFTGTSPGFRQLHARVDGSDEVVIAELSDYEFEPKAESWIDKNIVKPEEKDLQSVTLTGVTLERKDEQWHVQGLTAQEETNKEQVETLLRKITGLTIQTVMDPKEAAEQFKAEPVLKYSLGYTNGNKVEYVFVKPGEEYHILKASNRDFHYKVDNWMVEAISKVKRADLVQEKQGEAAKVEESEAGEAAGNSEQGQVSIEPEQDGEGK